MIVARVVGWFCSRVTVRCIGCIVSRYSQILRRVLEFGIPGLEHPQMEFFFQGLLQRMQRISATLERLQAQMTAHGIVPGGLAGSGDGGGVLSEVQELWERMAAIAVDAQKDHPIGFRRYAKFTLSYIAVASCGGNVPRTLHTALKPDRILDGGSGRRDAISHHT